MTLTPKFSLHDFQSWHCEYALVWNLGTITRRKKKKHENDENWSIFMCCLSAH
jgi:hypothetical protein